MHAHARVHSHVRAKTLTCALTHVHAHTRACTLAHAFMLARSCVYAHVHLHALTHAHPHVHSHLNHHTCVHSHICTRMHTRTWEDERRGVSRAFTLEPSPTHALTRMHSHAHLHTGGWSARASHGQVARRWEEMTSLRPGAMKSITRFVTRRPIESAVPLVPLGRPLHLDQLWSEKWNPRWHFWPCLVPQLHLEQTGAFLGSRGVCVAQDRETDHRGRVLPESHPWPNEPHPASPWAWASASGKPDSVRAASPVAPEASVGTPRHQPPPAPPQTRKLQLTSRTWARAWATAGPPSHRKERLSFTCSSF